MPVNGLMLTLTEESSEARRVVEVLSEREEIELGVVEDRWMSVVVDAPDQKEAKRLHSWLESVDGIEQVEVICVAFDEDPTPENDE